MLTAGFVLVVVTLSQSEGRYVLNPSQRIIMKLKQLYFEDETEDLCKENPVMGTECDICHDMGLDVRNNCCSDLLQFSDCHHQLVPLLQRLETFDNWIPYIPEIDETAEPAIKRYASTFARWGFSRGVIPVQWGRPIVARKRYGMASGKRFSFKRFTQGDYSYYKRHGGKYRLRTQTGEMQV